MKAKRCIVCGEIKQETDFYRDIKNVTGRRNVCKRCQQRTKRAHVWTEWREMREIDRQIKGKSFQEKIDFLEAFIGKQSIQPDRPSITEQVLDYAHEKLYRARLDMLCRQKSKRPIFEIYNKKDLS